MTEPAPIDLAGWTPAGISTTEYAIRLLSSLNPDEVRAAEAWLLGHPPDSAAALVAALHTQAAQPAAVLLGRLGDPAAIEPLVAAHLRGGEGLRAAVERALALDGSPRATEALAAIRR